MFRDVLDVAGLKRFAKGIVKNVERSQNVVNQPGMG